MSNPHSLKVIRYSARMIYINEYLDVLPGARASEKICETELNEILLKIMPNSWSNQSCV